MATYAIVGTGGHGRETMAMAQQMLAKKGSSHELVFVDVEVNNPEINGVQVLTLEQFLGRSGEKFFNPAIANSSVRRKVAGEMTQAGAEPFSVFASSFCNLGHNNIGKGAIFSPFTTVTVNATIGDYFHANNYAGVSHDCVIGDYVTFAPGVKCNGAVVIEDDVYVGAGAVIKQSMVGRPIVLGTGSIIGMGSVVTKSVPPGATVFGNQAVIQS